MEAIRVMLVDDHDIVRTGLRSFLSTQPGLEVVGEASSGAEALARAQESSPDVIVMDISMPHMDGMEATRRLKAQFPETRILALTVHEDKQYLFEMMAAGAEGYITKQAAVEDLVAAIRSVAAGNIYLQPALARWLLDDYQRLARDSAKRSAKKKVPIEGKSLDVLSAREQQVLEQVAEGLTNNQIGERLGISPKTVARHRERIMNKLDLHSCSELVKFAIRSGLIEL